MTSGLRAVRAAAESGRQCVGGAFASTKNGRTRAGAFKKIIVKKAKFTNFFATNYDGVDRTVDNMSNPTKYNFYIFSVDKR